MLFSSVTINRRRKEKTVDGFLLTCLSPFKSICWGNECFRPPGGALLAALWLLAALSMCGSSSSLTSSRWLLSPETCQTDSSGRPNTQQSPCRSVFMQQQYTQCSIKRTERSFTFKKQSSVICCILSSVMMIVERMKFQTLALVHLQWLTVFEFWVKWVPLFIHSIPNMYKKKHPCCEFAYVN